MIAKMTQLGLESQTVVKRYNNRRLSIFSVDLYEMVNAKDYRSK